jgi:hypothetical protein
METTPFNPTDWIQMGGTITQALHELLTITLQYEEYEEGRRRGLRKRKSNSNQPNIKYIDIINSIAAEEVQRT